MFESCVTCCGVGDCNAVFLLESSRSEVSLSS